MGRRMTDLISWTSQNFQHASALHGNYSAYERPTKFQKYVPQAGAPPAHLQVALPPPPPPGAPPAGRVMVCHACGREGHTVRNCRDEQAKAAYEQSYSNRGFVPRGGGGYRGGGGGGYQGRGSGDQGRGGGRRPFYPGRGRSDQVGGQPCRGNSRGENVGGSGAPKPVSG